MIAFRRCPHAARSFLKYVNAFSPIFAHNQNGVDDFDVFDDIAEINTVGTVKTSNQTKQVKYHPKLNC